jgi:hypothetical protein
MSDTNSTAPLDITAALERVYKGSDGAKRVEQVVIRLLQRLLSETSRPLEKRRPCHGPGRYGESKVVAGRRRRRGGILLGKLPGGQPLRPHRQFRICNLGAAGTLDFSVTSVQFLWK